MGRHPSLSVDEGEDFVRFPHFNMFCSDRVAEMTTQERHKQLKIAMGQGSPVPRWYGILTE